MSKDRTTLRGLTLGFTLAELLISLAILGVIATFTIPKILSAQQNAADSAKVKEAMASVSQAYQLYQQSNPVTASTTSAALTPYLNYISVDTASTLDDSPGWGTLSCTAYRCLKLHNGATLVMANTESLSGTGANNAWWFLVDPDSVQNSTKPSVTFFLYYNGRLTSAGKCNTAISSLYSYICTPSNDPSWFSF